MTHAQGLAVYLLRLFSSKSSWDAVCDSIVYVC